MRSPHLRAGGCPQRSITPSPHPTPHTHTRTRRDASTLLRAANNCVEKLESFKTANEQAPWQALARDISLETQSAVLEATVFAETTRLFEVYEMLAVLPGLGCLAHRMDLAVNECALDIGAWETARDCARALLAESKFHPQQLQRVASSRASATLVRFYLLRGVGAGDASEWEAAIRTLVAAEHVGSLVLVFAAFRCYADAMGCSFAEGEAGRCVRGRALSRAPTPPPPPLTHPPPSHSRVPHLSTTTPAPHTAAQPKRALPLGGKRAAGCPDGRHQNAWELLSPRDSGGAHVW